MSVAKNQVKELHSYLIRYLKSSETIDSFLDDLSHTAAFSKNKSFRETIHFLKEANESEDSTAGITRDDFIAYETLRQSGRINMFEVSNGCLLTGLTEEKYMSIMKNYSKLNAAWPDVRHYV